MQQASQKKHLIFDHMGTPFKFVLNTEVPISALYVKIGGREERFDSRETFELFDLLLRHLPAIERLQAGVPISLKMKLAREE